VTLNDGTFISFENASIVSADAWTLGIKGSNGGLSIISQDNILSIDYKRNLVQMSVDEILAEDEADSLISKVENKLDKEVK